MPGVALFGNSAARSQSGNLVEFKAGKMTMIGNMVHSDKRKGWLYVHQSADGLMHFCWKDRTTGDVEDDLIIFRDECEFKKVNRCTTGRVYVLKFKASARRFFVWVQEPSSDKDEENARKINEVLNNPPTPGSRRGREPTGEDVYNYLAQTMSPERLQELISGVQTGDVSSLFGAMGQAPTSGSRPSTPGSDSGSIGQSGQTPQNPIQLGDLQSVLSGLGVIPEGSESNEQDSDSDSTGTGENGYSSDGTIESGYSALMSYWGAATAAEQTEQTADSSFPDTANAPSADKEVRQNLPSTLGDASSRSQQPRSSQSKQALSRQAGPDRSEDSDTEPPKKRKKTEDGEKDEDDDDMDHD